MSSKKPEKDDELASLSAKALKDSVDAALKITEADFIIVAAGAGMSADSGLAVYTDIAKVPCYQENDITYKELCDQILLRKNQVLFWSFWGNCYNNYKDAEPHKGYFLLKKIQKKLEKRKKKQLSESWKQLNSISPYDIHERYLSSHDELRECSKSPMYIITSNVDRQFEKAGFHRNQIREIHGACENMQCSIPCRPRCWTLRE